MSYQYITNDNLETPQNYMYSKFEGHTFLDVYKESRINKLESYYDSRCCTLESIVADFLKMNTPNKSYSFKQMKQLLEHILGTETENDIVYYEIDKWLKIFEVRKRIYDSYIKGTFKPEENASYKRNELYILFALLMSVTYMRTETLTYLNALLKVNDTILSIWDKLTEKEISIMQYILQYELSYVGKLQEKVIFREAKKK